MYYDHFGLNEPPFRITPDTRLFYEGGNRGAILDAVVFAISTGEGIIKIVGEVGSGKTMLCRMLEVRLPANVEVVYLANPSLSPDNILHAIAFEMKLPVTETASRLQVMQSLQQYLLDKHAENRQVVVFVEEAQSMPLETLEEIRLLSNLETQRFKLLQIVMFGQPELEPNLSAPRIRQLRERITHSFELPPFNEQEIREYIDLRLRTAGYRGPELFTPRAIRRIARRSRGLTRRINILADKSLLAAYAAGSHTVGPREVRVAIRDSEFGKTRWRWPWRGLVVTMSIALLLAATGLWWWSGEGEARLARLFEDVRPSSLAGRSTLEEQTAPVPGGPAPAETRPLDATAERPATARRDESFSRGLAVARVIAQSDDAEIVHEAVIREAPIQEDLIQEDVIETPVQVPAPARPMAESTRNEVIASTAAPAPRLSPAADVGPGYGAEGETVIEQQSMIGATEPMPAVVDLDTEAADASEASDPYPEDFFERRLAVTREWLETADPEHFSIQLMLVSAGRTARLEQNLADGGLGDRLDQIYLYRTRIRGDNLVSVLLGDFARYADAEAALAGLPAPMRAAQPFIRNLRDVRWVVSARLGGL